MIFVDISCVHTKVQPTPLVPLRKENMSLRSRCLWEKVNGRIRELHDELARDEQQDRCKCSMHLALFASSHLTAFLLHTDCAYVVSYSCSIFLSDKATWSLLTRTQRCQTNFKVYCFLDWRQRRRFWPFEKCYRRRARRQWCHHEWKTSEWPHQAWAYSTIGVGVLFDRQNSWYWWKYCRRSEGGCYAAPAKPPNQLQNYAVVILQALAAE